jgi:sirohydrochlorin cobaltochelatase
MAPSLGDAVAAAAAAGAGRLVILPVFVAAGNHLRHDLPALVAELRRAHRGIAIDVLAPVGEDARFADAVAAIAADALLLDAVIQSLRVEPTVELTAPITAD